MAPSILLHHPRLSIIRHVLPQRGDDADHRVDEPGGVLHDHGHDEVDAPRSRRRVELGQRRRSEGLGENTLAGGVEGPWEGREGREDGVDDADEEEGKGDYDRGEELQGTER